MSDSSLGQVLTDQDDEASLAHIAVMGTPGVGKSSTINGLFSTRIPVGERSLAMEHETFLPLDKVTYLQGQRVTGGHGDLMVFELPGLNGNRQHDAQVLDLYKHVLPTVDAALWVLAAVGPDDTHVQKQVRDLKRGLRRSFDRIVFAINKVDELPGQWFGQVQSPDDNMYDNIQRRAREVQKSLKVNKQRVVPYAAKYRYRLVALLRAMLEVVPPVRRIPVLTVAIVQDRTELMSPEGQQDTREFLKHYQPPEQ